MLNHTKKKQKKPEMLKIITKTKENGSSISEDGALNLFYCQEAQSVKLTYNISVCPGM